MSISDNSLQPGILSIWFSILLPHLSDAALSNILQLLHSHCYQCGEVSDNFEGKCSLFVKL